MAKLRKVVVMNCFTLVYLLKEVAKVGSATNVHVVEEVRRHPTRLFIYDDPTN